MYDRNDRSRGQADGNVKGATKGWSDVHGIDSAVDRSCPVRRLAASETLRARRMRGEDLSAGTRELHGPPSASLRRRIAGVGRFTSCTNPHIASAGPVSRRFVHVVHRLRAASHKATSESRRSPRHGVGRVIAFAAPGVRTCCRAHFRNATVAVTTPPGPGDRFDPSRLGNPEHRDGDGPRLRVRAMLAGRRASACLAIGAGVVRCNETNGRRRYCRAAGPRRATTRSRRMPVGKPRAGTRPVVAALLVEEKGSGRRAGHWTVIHARPETPPFPDTRRPGPVGH